MDEKPRVASGSSNTSGVTVKTVAGVTTADSAELECGCPEPGPETIEVEQVLGAEMAQRVVELDLFVPAQKPDIEQVVDVYVKDLEITKVDVIPDKVIVRGELEVKVMYVADLPDQPVHAFEKKHIRWTRDIEISGAEPDMKATADATVEFVDYDFHRHHDNRKVHITIVLKVWARVVTTTEMDVYALSPVDEVGIVEGTTSSDKVSASQFGDEVVSAAETGGGNIAGFGEQNVIVTGPMTPTAGTSTSVSGTVTVTGSVVNVRTGPGTNFPVAAKVNKGTTLTVKEQAFGWYKVVLPDGTTTGWIASWLVTAAT
ncbi:SPOCS domain-containing protein [Sporomusa acidovorans]|uniref:SH3b domain-containing protein n=1 Tax=Sporomusa acidovorans (strain ATCC 49682 / DSM 3132 / Mol) TaxID=1123286 RepID=A0ABZ3IWH7_SPOA4|nr:SPOCS domain-containing protein [Sporomusa acidovorans]OZC14016.1 bacterial SH3 domain protein [Sporomusa acidovorans DSM 3132]SDF22499.1 SH3 domain-containing protein [Sporomusa acidovorans]